MVRIFGVLIIIQLGFTQQVQEGSPYSRIQGLDNYYHIIDLPLVDTESLLEEDSNMTNGAPYRYGYQHYVEFSTENSGIWEETAEGGLFWQIILTSENAHSLSFDYENFFSPKVPKPII